ncbi:MAG: methyltransferase domain-containing protein [Candidatus Pacebacteria bacterium]|nr:methyltransferase domain-containing protein [Candidatus Paceibacterota bacterium]
MNEGPIKGSGKDYFKYMGPDLYRARITTPARSLEYFKQFHEPLIERTKQRFGSPIRLMDIACGPAEELSFFKNDPDIKIIATDISAEILHHVISNVGTNAAVFVSDANFPATKEGIADAGIMVNVSAYVPDKMLQAMYHALRPGGQCAVNFFVFDNRFVPLGPFTQRGGKILNGELKVNTKDGEKVFNVIIADYRDVRKNDASADKEIQQVGQQIYFASIEDVREVIRTVGFTEVQHSKYQIKPNDKSTQTDVFILEKPLA